MIYAINISGTNDMFMFMFTLLSSDEYLTNYTGDTHRNVQRGLRAKQFNCHTRLTTVKRIAQNKI